MEEICRRRSACYKETHRGLQKHISWAMADYTSNGSFSNDVKDLKGLTRKQIAERERRARINRYLGQLEILTSQEQQSVGPVKLEKTEVLERTVNYLQTLKNLQVNDMSHVQYKAGYSQCMYLLFQYLETSDLQRPEVQSLYNHLISVLQQNTSVSEHSYFSQEIGQNITTNVAHVKENGHSLVENGQISQQTYSCYSKSLNGVTHMSDNGLTYMSHTGLTTKNDNYTHFISQEELFSPGADKNRNNSEAFGVQFQYSSNGNCFRHTTLDTKNRNESQAFLHNGNMKYPECFEDVSENGRYLTEISGDLFQNMDNHLLDSSALSVSQYQVMHQMGYTHRSHFPNKSEKENQNPSSVWRPW